MTRSYFCCRCAQAASAAAQRSARRRVRWAWRRSVLRMAVAADLHLRVALEEELRVVARVRRVAAEAAQHLAGVGGVGLPGQRVRLPLEPEEDVIAGDGGVA